MRVTAVYLVSLTFFYKSFVEIVSEALDRRQCNHVILRLYAFYRYLKYDDRERMRTESDTQTHIRSRHFHRLSKASSSKMFHNLTYKTYPVLVAASDNVQQST